MALDTALRKDRTQLAGELIDNGPKGTRWHQNEQQSLRFLPLEILFSDVGTFGSASTLV